METRTGWTEHLRTQGHQGLPGTLGSGRGRKELWEGAGPGHIWSRLGPPAFSEGKFLLFWATQVVVLCSHRKHA